MKMLYLCLDLGSLGCEVPSWSSETGSGEGVAILNSESRPEGGAAVPSPLGRYFSPAAVPDMTATSVHGTPPLPKALQIGKSVQAAENHTYLSR